MVEIKISVSEELREKLNKLNNINWSAVATLAFLQKIADVEFLGKFKSESDITEKDALKFGKALNERLSKRYIGE